MSNLIEIKNLNLWFGEKQALKDVSFTIPEKKIISLIGPSGCGKSTLLRCLNRMHDLNPNVKINGEILIEDQNILNAKANVVEIRRNVGMVFQKPNPFPKTIFENIAFGLRINGIKDKETLENTVEESLRNSFLWDEVKDDLEKSGLQLSGGQQQRLCIARAIAVKPKVILMDEPCSALDPISTAKIEELILNLKNDYTIIIVTHNMQQAQRVADYTAVMYLGELMEYGDTSQIFGNAANETARNYVNGVFG